MNDFTRRWLGCWLGVVKMDLVSNLNPLASRARHFSSSGKALLPVLCMVCEKYILYCSVLCNYIPDLDGSMKEKWQSLTIELLSKIELCWRKIFSCFEILLVN